MHLKDRQHLLEQLDLRSITGFGLTMGGKSSFWAVTSNVERCVDAILKFGPTDWTNPWRCHRSEYRRVQLQCSAEEIPSLNDCHFNVAARLARWNTICWLFCIRRNQLNFITEELKNPFRWDGLCIATVASQEADAFNASQCSGTHVTGQQHVSCHPGICRWPSSLGSPWWRSATWWSTSLTSLWWAPLTCCLLQLLLW